MYVCVNVCIGLCTVGLAVGANKRPMCANCACVVYIRIGIKKHSIANDRRRNTLLHVCVLNQPKLLFCQPRDVDACISQIFNSYIIVFFIIDKVSTRCVNSAE